MNDEGILPSLAEPVEELSAKPRVRLSGSIAVAARSGGKGKTTTTQVIAHLLQLDGLSIDLYSLDASADGSLSKLKHILPETTDLRFGASMEEVAKDPAASLDHFDQIGEILSQGGALFDFGANVAPVFFGWASVSGLTEMYGKIPPLTVVVPVTANAVSIADAVEIIADAGKSFAEVPIKKIVVVYNERDGVFSSQVAGYDKLKGLEKGLEKDLKKGGEEDDGSDSRKDGDRSFQVTSITMPLLPKINATFWDKVELHQMSFREVLETHPADLTKKLGMAGLQASRGRIAMREWLNELVEAFNGVGLTD